MTEEGLLDPNGPQDPIIFAEPQRLPGSYLFFSAIGVAFIGFLLLGISRLMLREELRAAIWVRPAHRPAYSVAASRALFAGALLWALGALALPWAPITAGCAPVALLPGNCAGHFFGDALQRGLSGNPDLLNPRIGLYALEALFVYLALLALAGLWRRVPLRLLTAWTALWLACAAITAGFALRGAISASPGALGPGPFVALAGLLLAALALVWLRAAAAEAPTSPAAVN